MPVHYVKMEQTAPASITWRLVSEIEQVSIVLTVPL